MDSMAQYDKYTILMLRQELELAIRHEKLESLGMNETMLTAAWYRQQQYALDKAVLWNQ